MLTGPDVSSSQGSFNFATAFQQGHRACYIKLGGDNIPEYVSGSYAQRVDAARGSNFIVGHYWITGGHSPASAAAFYVRNLRGVTGKDFFVLDNERLDSGNPYNDAETALWVKTVASLLGVSTSRIFVYGSKYFFQGQSWTETLATGARFIIANYTGTPFSGGFAPNNIPADRIVGHQYTDSANVGGWSPVDMNAFTDNAFTYSGTSSTTATPLTGENDNMARILNIHETIDGKTTDNTIFFDGGPGVGIKGISSIQHKVLLDRYIANATGDKMYPAELAIVNGYLTPSKPSIDPKPLTDAVTAAVNAALANVKVPGVTVDDAAIAAAVDAVLADNFKSVLDAAASIPAATVAAEGKKLSA
jgi:hypothetical protein